MKQVRSILLACLLQHPKLAVEWMKKLCFCIYLLLSTNKESEVSRKMI